MSIYKGEKLISGSVSASAYPKPDWAGAVKLDSVGVYMDGYTAPSNGMIVGWFKFNNHIAILNLNINNITVARSSLTNSSSSTSSECSVQCPVNEGNYIKLNNEMGTISSNNISAALYFVPYKAQ